MKQVFVNQHCEIDTYIQLDDKQAHHLFDVLRTNEKEVVRVVNQESQVFLAHAQKKPALYLFNQLTTEQNMQHVTLCAALIKGDKFEWMLQKAAELGVTRIVPYISRNTVVQLDPAKQKKKLERWSNILLEACKQCNRNDLVELTPIESLDGLYRYQGQLNLVAYEKETNAHLADYLPYSPQSITICIGPEGGFEDFEITQLKEQHFQPCSLGNKILRAETAACYILSAVEYQSHCKEKE